MLGASSTTVTTGVAARGGAGGGILEGARRRRVCARLSLRRRDRRRQRAVHGLALGPSRAGTPPTGAAPGAPVNPPLTEMGGSRCGPLELRWNPPPEEPRLAPLMAYGRPAQGE